VWNERSSVESFSLPAPLRAEKKKTTKNQKPCHKRCLIAPGLSGKDTMEWGGSRRLGGMSQIVKFRSNRKLAHREMEERRGIRCFSYVPQCTGEEEDGTCCNKTGKKRGDLAKERARGIQKFARKKRGVKRARKTDREIKAHQKTSNSRSEGGKSNDLWDRTSGNLPSLEEPRERPLSGGRNFRGKKKVFFYQAGLGKNVGRKTVGKLQKRPRCGSGLQKGKPR